MTTQELTQYYVNLLLMQYQKVKAQAQVALFVGEMVQNQIISQCLYAFDLETAVGAQLDLLASYKGAQRELFGISLSRNYWTFARYGFPDPGNGFARYSSPVLVSWLFITYALAQAPVYSLTDAELRLLTQFLVTIDSMMYGLGTFDQLLQSFFGNYVGLIDNLNMTQTYAHLTSDQGTLFNIINFAGVLPRAAGVLSNVVEEDSFSMWFAFDLYGEPHNPIFVGFSRLLSPTSGTWLRYS